MMIIMVIINQGFFLHLYEPTVTWKRHQDLLSHGPLLPFLPLFFLSSSSHWQAWTLGPAERTMHYPAITTSIYITPSITITLLPSTSLYSACLPKVEFSWNCPIFPGGIMLPMQMAKSPTSNVCDIEKQHHHFFDTHRKKTCKTKRATTSCCLRPGTLLFFLQW